MVTKETLIDVLNKTKGLPVLFIGSGLSIRYLGLPNWTGLLDIFAQQALAGIVDMPFEYLRDRGKASREEGIPELAILAGDIEERFNETWHTSPNYSDRRKILGPAVSAGASPFKLEVAAFTEKASFIETDALSKEVALIRKLEHRNIASVITTNYDNLVRDLFPTFKIFVGQDELLFNHSEGLAESYKIHGCCTKPASLVLTREDYKQFYSQNAYLTSKLVTCFWEHPIIFLGYSLNDDNIWRILSTITSSLTEDKLTEIGTRLIFVEWNNTAKPSRVESYTKSFNKKNLPMTRVFLEDYSMLYEALLEYRPTRQYPTALLRRLKDDIYNLVVSSTPSNTIVVSDGIDPDIDPLEYDKVKFVIGVGTLTEKGYDYINIHDLYRDIILDSLNSNLDAERVVYSTLPLHRINNGGIGPLFKYVASLPEDKILSADPNVLKEVKERTFDGFFNGTIRKKRADYSNKTIASLRAEHSDLDKCCRHVCHLAAENFDSHALHQLLVDTLTQHPECLDVFRYKSDVKRLIRLYDWLKYGRELQLALGKN